MQVVLDESDIATVLNAFEYLLAHCHGHPVGASEAVTILHNALDQCEEEDEGCPCGHDGGTSCGSPNCYLLTGNGYETADR